MSLATSPHYLARREHFVGVVERDDLIGYAWAQDFGPHLRSGDSVARLHDLWVEERARRRGVGRELFEAVQAWATDRGVRWLQWQAGTSAAAFYRALRLTPTPRDDSIHPFYELDLG